MVKSFEISFTPTLIGSWKKVRTNHKSFSTLVAVVLKAEISSFLDGSTRFPLKYRGFGESG